jgi:hypothetical protein
LRKQANKPPVSGSHVAARVPVTLVRVRLRLKLRWTPSDVISTREFLIARVNHRVSYHQFRAARSGRAVYMSAIKHEISRRQTAATGFPGRTKSRQYMDFVFLKNAFKCICDAFNDAVIE